MSFRLIVSAENTMRTESRLQALYRPVQDYNVVLSTVWVVGPSGSPKLRAPTRILVSDDPSNCAEGMPAPVKARFALQDCLALVSDDPSSCEEGRPCPRRARFALKGLGSPSGVGCTKEAASRGSWLHPRRSGEGWRASELGVILGPNSRQPLATKRTASPADRSSRSCSSSRCRE